MPDPTGNTKRANYSQEDANARRLWSTQIGKADPWAGRDRNLEGADDQAAPQPPAAEMADSVPTVMISQQDRLRLRRPEQDAENPFESLIAHQLHLKPPDQLP